MIDNDTQQVLMALQQTVQHCNDAFDRINELLLDRDSEPAGLYRSLGLATEGFSACVSAIARMPQVMSLFAHPSSTAQEQAFLFIETLTHTLEAMSRTTLTLEQIEQQSHHLDNNYDEFEAELIRHRLELHGSAHLLQTIIDNCAEYMTMDA